MKEYDILQVHEYDQIFSWMLYSRLKLPTVIYHGPYFHEYARGYKKFYCIRCGGLNLRSWKN